MEKPLKVGIIGLGNIANVHIAGWAESPLAEVVAGCDIDPLKIDHWNKEYNLKKFAYDAAELINDPDIDIIDICTPNNCHAPQTIAALEAGKHVLCEKPLAPTVDEIRRMIAARDASGKMLMTAHQLRFTGTARALKNEIDSGALGAIYHARAWWLRRAGAPIRPSLIYKSQAYAGVGIDLGVHVIDLVLWLMGNPQPVTVSGVACSQIALQDGAFSDWGGEIPKDFDVDEFAAGFVRFENGASLMIEVSWLLNHTTDQDDVQTWLYGTKAGAHWPSCMLYETNNVLKQHYDRILKKTEDRIRPHYLECVEFAEAIMRDGPSPVPSEQSLQVGQILEALYKSQEIGREVEIAN
ncbi:MAG: Gfo/Idh/MocA family protein [Anaerolineales bacterium]